MNANLVSVWREAWRPPDRRPPWAWAEAHVTSIPYSPIPGRFRSDNSPQIREPLEALIDPRVRVVFIIAAIQSGKTSVGELGLCHIIANLPGPTLWLDQTDDDAKDQADYARRKSTAQWGQSGCPSSSRIAAPAAMQGALRVS